MEGNNSCRLAPSLFPSSEKDKGELKSQGDPKMRANVDYFKD